MVGSTSLECCFEKKLVYMALQPNDNTAAAVMNKDIAPALFVLRALLLEVLLVDVVGEVVGVEFVNSKHDAIPASSDLLWQHLSIVQKPALFGIG
jgi:hypothetical protein